MQIVVDPVEVNRRVFRTRKRKLFRSKVVLTEQVVQLELACFAGLAYLVLFGSECGEIAPIASAVIVRTFISIADAVFFPVEQRRSAVGHQYLALLSRRGLSVGEVRLQILH